jgi:RimJ/RimL family protein N-acetyltransferase
MLRYPMQSDGPRLLSAFQSDDFPRYVPLGQFDRMGQVREWIEGAQTRWGKGQGYTWTAESKTEGTVIGQVSLVQMDEDDTWSLAFWIHSDCWGQGYGTEIAQGAIGFAFHELSAARVWAAAAKWNLASLQVLRKLGMTYLGDNPDGYRINDEPIPTSEFVIELSDWAGLHRFNQE